MTVKLTCPLCEGAFQARTMGSNYYIGGTDSDLRETGSIEEVRRFSVISCPRCRLSDYAWNFQAPEELDDEQKTALRDALEFDPNSHPNPLPHMADFERFRLTAQCFTALGMDNSTLAELALLAYYVARDLGRRDLEPSMRDEAANLLSKALDEEELPAPLRLRYSYLAGELNRRAGRREEALRAFDEAIQASQEAALEEDPRGDAWNVGRLARRMQTAALHHDASAEDLLHLTQDEDEDAAYEARRILAARRDRASVEATRQVWGDTAPEERGVLLRELRTDPPAALFDLFVSALEDSSPETVRLAAHTLRSLGDPRAAAPLVKALRRGILSTEVAIVDALRATGEPEQIDQLKEILLEWEQANAPSGNPDLDAWRFSSDPTPIRNLLYTDAGAYGLELLIRDMKLLSENDLWDKIPSGGPVSAALAMGTQEVALALRGLLSAESPATRRWAAYCLAELQVDEATADIAQLIEDPDSIVRLQAASALARRGDTSQEAVVLKEIRSLSDEDIPFALHFLVPFRSAAVKAYLLEQLQEGSVTTPSEVLPLLGRQEADEEVTSILNSSLLDTDDDTRAGGVTGLAFQGGADVAERLRMLYDQEESDEVRRRIVFGLGKLARAGDQVVATVEFLRERLSWGTPILRFSIALTLLQLGDPSGIDLVRERAALFHESFDRYDLVAPALKSLAEYDHMRQEVALGGTLKRRPLQAH